jgi:hypothetical protein
VRKAACDLATPATEQPMRYFWQKRRAVCLCWSRQTLVGTTRLGPINGQSRIDEGAT